MHRCLQGRRGPVGRVSDSGQLSFSSPRLKRNWNKTNWSLSEKILFQFIHVSSHMCGRLNAATQLSCFFSSDKSYRKSVHVRRLYVNTFTLRLQYNSYKTYYAPYVTMLMVGVTQLISSAFRILNISESVETRRVEINWVSCCEHACDCDWLRICCLNFNNQPPTANANISLKNWVTTDYGN